MSISIHIIKSLGKIAFKDDVMFIYHKVLSHKLYEITVYFITKSILYLQLYRELLVQRRRQDYHL